MDVMFPRLRAIATRNIRVSLLSDLSSTHMYGDALVWIKLDCRSPRSRVFHMNGSEQAKRHERQTRETGASWIMFNSLNIFTKTSVSISSHLLPMNLVSAIFTKLMI